MKETIMEKIKLPVEVKTIIDTFYKNNFEIFIDGGINAETISKVKDADGVVSGSFICKSEDYEKRIRILR